MRFLRPRKNRSKNVIALLALFLTSVYISNFVSNYQTIHLTQATKPRNQATRFAKSSEFELKANRKITTLFIPKPHPQDDRCPPKSLDLRDKQLPSYMLPAAINRNWYLWLSNLDELKSAVDPISEILHENDNHQIIPFCTLRYCHERDLLFSGFLF